MQGFAWNGFEGPSLGARASVGGAGRSPGRAESHWSEAAGDAGGAHPQEGSQVGTRWGAVGAGADGRALGTRQAGGRKEAREGVAGCVRGPGRLGCACWRLGPGDGREAVE